MNKLLVTSIGLPWLGLLASIIFKGATLLGIPIFWVFEFTGITLMPIALRYGGD